MTQHPIKEEQGFRYIDEGQGPVLLLLHGLFGGLSNFSSVIEFFRHNYRVVIPVLPLYEMPVRQAGIPGLVKFVADFVEQKSLGGLTIIGNSLGGHIGLVYALENPEHIDRMVLTGSSGLFENATSGNYPKRGNYEFVKERVGYTFFDPNVATKELVDEVFETTKSIPRCMRMVAIAKSAQRHNMAEDLAKITAPTLLVWGLNDTITPPLVAYDFNRLMPHTRLRFIDQCGHAPMMEHPSIFNHYLSSFLESTSA